MLYRARQFRDVLLAGEYGSYSDAMMAIATELDLRGLKCPLPVLRTRKALRRLGAGQVIEVICTDPLASIDIPHFVQSEGHRLESRHVVDGVTRFVIVKGALPAGP